MRARSITVLSLFALLAAGLALCFADRDATSHDVSSPTQEPRPTVTTNLHSESQRVRVDAARSLRGYEAPVGSQFGFAFRHLTEYSLEILPGHGDAVVPMAGETVRIPVRGALDMQVVQRDAESITVRVQARDVETPVEGRVDARGEKSLQACRDALQTWFLVRIDSRGRVLGYAFQKGYRASDRNFVRAFMAAFFHNLSEDDSLPRWRANGSDAMGDYVADFRRLQAEPVVVERRKRQYTKVGQQKSVPPHRVSGRSTAQFDATTGWIDRVAVEDVVQMDVVEFPSRVHVRVEASFERVSVSHAEVTVEPSQWPAFVSASGALENLAADSIANEREKWRTALADVSFENLLQTLQALIEAGDTRSQAFYAAWERVSWKLRLDPKSVAAAQELLLTGALRENTGSMLLSALGNAGSDQAQNALLAVFGSKRLEAGWKETAAVAMFQLRKPSARVLETMSARLAGLQQIGQLDATSMLLFGTLASRSKQSLQSGRSPMAQLLSLEQRSADLGASGLWLDALGNAAVPAVAKRVLPYLSHQDAIVRESAVAALDRSNARGIDPRLIDVAKRDPSRDVRLRAIEALGKRADERGRATIRTLALEAKDIGIRRAALQALAGQKTLGAKDRQVLQRLARTEQVADLRDAARQLLAGRR